MSKKYITPDDYLEQLSAELHTLPKEERAAVLDEIRTHIEQAAEDETFGTNAIARQMKLAEELGHPSDLATGMKHVYRPKRLTDFLLAIVPSIILPMAVGVMASRMFGVFDMLRWHSLLLTLAILPFIALSLRRPSPELRLFWLGFGLLTTVGAAFKNPLTLGSMFGLSWVDTTFYVGLSLGLGALFGRTLKQHRHDPLLNTWAWLPIIAAVVGAAFNIVGARLLPVNIMGEGYRIAAIINLIATPLVFALFFLPSRRLHRWLALVAFAATKVATFGVIVLPHLWWNPMFFVVAIVMGLSVGQGLWREQKLRKWRRYV